MHQKVNPPKVLTVEASFALVRDLVEAYNSIVQSNLSQESRLVFCEMATNAIKMVNCSLAIVTAHTEKHRNQAAKAASDHAELMRVFDECEWEQRTKMEQLRGALVAQTSESARLAIQNRHAWSELPDMLRKLEVGRELTNAACQELVSVLQNEAS